MKTTMTMKTTKMLGAGMALILIGAIPLSGQGVVAPSQECQSGVIEGTLGISGLDCVGECTLLLRRDGSEDRWEFSTEPRIFSVDEGGPAHGILRAGDLLVAIDGELITTREGGRRYANIRVGEMVTVRFRRDGAIHEAGIRAGSHCRQLASPPAPVGRVTLPMPPVQPDAVREPRRVGVAPRSAGEPRGIGTAPRVRVAGAAYDSARGVARARGAYTPLGLLDPTPRGRLGIGLGCTECGTRTDEETGEDIWFFSGPIEVTQVNSGGPAEEAGIQLGDLITGIDGHDIATDAGGLAFSTLVPGEAVRITLVRRNGREETVTLIPSGSEAGFLRGTGVSGRFENLQALPDVAATPRPTLGVAPPSRPAVPDRADLPEATGGFSGPANLPLSYSGTVAGVEVVVRGGPIAVSEFKGNRTLIINADGLWIRVTVPAGSGSSGGEESDIRR